MRFNTHTHTYLIVWQHDESSSASTLHDDRKELRIDSAERRVPAGLTHTYVVVALLSFHCLSVHMSELAASHHPERHLIRGQEVMGRVLSGRRWRERAPPGRPQVTHLSNVTRQSQRLCSADAAVCTNCTSRRPPLTLRPVPATAQSETPY